MEEDYSKLLQKEKSKTTLQQQYHHRYHYKKEPNQYKLDRISGKINKALVFNKFN